MYTYLNTDAIQDYSISNSKLAMNATVLDSASRTRSVSLEWGKHYKLVDTTAMVDGLYSLTISGFSGRAGDATINEIFIEFEVADNFSLTTPWNVVWANGITPEFEPGWHYQISFMDNNYHSNGTHEILGICVGFPRA